MTDVTVAGVFNIALALAVVVGILLVGWWVGRVRGEILRRRREAHEEEDRE